VLEPMNPYERRVLHTALQNHPGVTTHSEGEEPNRRVVIMLAGQNERAEQEGKGEKNAKADKAERGDKPSSRRRRSRRGRRGAKNPQQGENAAVQTADNAAPVDVLGE